MNLEIIFMLLDETMKFTKSAVVTNLLILVSFGLFSLARSPLMTVKRRFIFENTFSLLSGLMQSFQSED